MIPETGRAVNVDVKTVKCWRIFYPLVTMYRVRANTYTYVGGSNYSTAYFVNIINAVVVDNHQLK